MKKSSFEKHIVFKKRTHDSNGDMKLFFICGDIL